MSLTREDSVQRNFAYEWGSGIVVPIMSVLLALIVAGLIIVFTGGNPFSAYSHLLSGAFGSPTNISETLVDSIPFMLSGLAVAFAFRAGLFNIGAEGQFLIGGIVSAYVGYKLNLQPVLLIFVALVAGAAGGAAWAAIAGILKAWRGAHEVITTIMLNYTAFQLLNFLLESTQSGKPGPMEQTLQPGFPESPPMNAHLPVIIPSSWVPNGRLHAGLFVALIMALIFWFILWRTTLGYKIRAVGLNPKAAAYSGISVGWSIVIAMCIAGAFAGMAGMVSVYASYPYQLTIQFSAGYGFDAIAVALLGRNTALGVIAAAILFGAFQHGGAIMQSDANVPARLIEIIEGLVIFFIGAEAIVRYLGRQGIIRIPRWQKEAAPA